MRSANSSDHERDPACRSSYRPIASREPDDGTGLLKTMDALEPLHFFTAGRNDGKGVRLTTCLRATMPE
jgi:hypothetical protein